MIDHSSFGTSSAYLLESLSPEASTFPSSSLTLLKPQRLLLPNHPSERAKAVVTCSRIAHVRIRETEKRDGNTFYVMEIYYKRKRNNIPAVQHLLGLETLEVSSPDAIKRQRFSTFANLRHEMHFHASTGHGAHPCEFCASMTKLLSNGPTIPRLSLKLFHGHESVALALEGFVNDVLRLINSSLSVASDRRLCDGQREIPLLLERFLMDDVVQSDTVVRPSRKARRRPN